MTGKEPYAREIAGSPLNVYTMDDVPNDRDGRPNYDLVGTHKEEYKGTFDLATMIKQQQVLRLPMLRDGSDAVLQFDVLGQPKALFDLM